MTWHSLVLALSVLGTTAAGASETDPRSFDGITIIEFSDEAGKEAIANGDHIVLFVAARGSYGAVVPSRGTHGGCRSLAVPGSYTGASITFGTAADPLVRQHRLQTYCPVFTLQFEGPGLVRITAPDAQAAGRNRYDAVHRVVTQVPLRALDFEAAPFAQHDLKGVRLGPVLDPESLGGLKEPGGSEDVHKSFTRHVEEGIRRTNVMGRAAAAEVTGWPWDVLYFAQFFEELEQTSTLAAFDRAVLDRYGEASTADGESDPALWIYNLDGERLALNGASDDICHKTMEFWLAYDPQGQPFALNWEFNSHDIGPWGCALIMELNSTRSGGGVTGYQVRAGSGYVMAINHFLQRIEQTTELLAEVKAFQSISPKF